MVWAGKGAEGWQANQRTTMQRPCREQAGLAVRRSHACQRQQGLHPATAAARYNPTDQDVGRLRQVRRSSHPGWRTQSVFIDDFEAGLLRTVGSAAAPAPSQPHLAAPQPQ